MGSTRALLASSVDRYFRAKCRRPSSRPYGPRTKKPELQEEATSGVSDPQSAESTNTDTAESDSDTE